MPHRAISTGFAADLPSGNGRSSASFGATSEPGRTGGHLLPRPRQVLQALRTGKGVTMAALVAGLVLSACATSPPSTQGPAIASAAAPAGGGLRDLTAAEKKVIVDSVSQSLRDPAAAKYHWTKLSTVPADDGSFNYCATVDAQSPYPAYNGRQAYIVEVKMGLGGKVTSAVMGLIAGGKDAAIVSKMCAKYNLDPNSAG
jgi:hypothetical protein